MFCNCVYALALIFPRKYTLTFHEPAPVLNWMRVRLVIRRLWVQPQQGRQHLFMEIWLWNIFYSHSHPSTESRSAVLSLLWRKQVHNTFSIQKVLIFFLFLCKNLCCGTHSKHLSEALLMSTHNIPFHREIRKIILCGYHHLSGAMLDVSLLVLDEMDRFVELHYCIIIKFKICVQQPQRSI